jgi:hypothetical protein
MIRTKRSLRPKQSYLSLSECEIEVCSSTCVFAHLPDEFKIIRHGHREDWPAIISKNRLWLNFSDTVHPPGHPLYTPEMNITQDEREALLKHISQAGPAHVVRVHEVCDCGLVIDLIEGWPLADINSWPVWHRSSSNQSVDALLAALSWTDFTRILSNLTEGLQNLHELGIAHADPFPINAMVMDKQGIWVDVNGIVSASPLSKAVDIWTYLTYTVMTRLLKLRTWDPEFLKRILTIVARAELHDILPQISQFLKQSANAPATADLPVVPGDLAKIAGMCSEYDMQLRTDELGDVARRLAPAGLVHFYISFEWNAQVAAERERYLAAEQVRHMLVEREIQRTLTLRYQVQIDELKGWTVELEQGRAWLEGQRNNWQKIAEHHEQIIQEQRGYITELEQAKAWLEEQRNNWQRTTEESIQIVQEQRDRIADLEKSQDWLEEQRANWHKMAEERGHVIQVQQDQIAESERSEVWLEEQRDNWQRIAEEREQIIQEQRTWIAELVRGKDWLEEQRDNWQRIAEERELVNRDQHD